MTDRSRRELARDHEPRLLKSQAGIESRPSRADERDLTTEVRRREAETRAAEISWAAEHFAVAEREITAACEALPRVDRVTWRTVERARASVRQARETLDQADGTREPA